MLPAALQAAGKGIIQSPNAVPSALKARHVIAQGEALGTHASKTIQPCKGVTPHSPCCVTLTGLSSLRSRTPGLHPGCHITALRA